MKREILRLTARAVSVLLAAVPTVAATLSYFPLWRGEGALATLSGFTLLLLLLSAVPLIKLARRFLSAPTATGMWFTVFIVFFILSKIADEMVVISLVGYISNLASSFLWKLSGRRGTDEEQA